MFFQKSVNLNFWLFKILSPLSLYRFRTCPLFDIVFPSLKRWEDNIKEWAGTDFASSTTAAENRTRWKGIVANSSVVP